MPSWTRSAWPNWTSAWGCGCRWRRRYGARRRNCRRCWPLAGRSWQKLDAATDLAGWSRPSRRPKRPTWKKPARSPRRAKAAPRLAQAVTQAMQGLGMQGGRFEVALQPTGSTRPRRPGRRRLSGERTRGQHAAADRQGGLRRRAVAHRAGHRRHDQRARRGADADLRRGRCRRRRCGGRDRRPPDEAARPRPPGAGRHAPAAGGGLRRPSSGGGQAAGAARAGPSSTESSRCRTSERRTHEVARMLGGERVSRTSLAHAREMLGARSAARPRP